MSHLGHVLLESGDAAKRIELLESSLFLAPAGSREKEGEASDPFSLDLFLQEAFLNPRYSSFFKFYLCILVTCKVGFHFDIIIQD